MSHLRMRVAKYIPEKFYGFCINDEGLEVFFHLRTFQGGDAPSRTVSVDVFVPIPPILGEEVEVEVDEKGSKPGRAPRAKRVSRLYPPRELSGIVVSYDARRGFGFVEGDNKVDYHLHNSEVLNGALPIVGGKVYFFPGLRRDRPRACHVRVCR